jgi:hypothetical protein
MQVAARPVSWFGWRGRFSRVLETWGKGNGTFGGAMVLKTVICPKYSGTTYAG